MKNHVKIQIKPKLKINLWRVLTNICNEKILKFDYKELNVIQLLGYYLYFDHLQLALSRSFILDIM